ncbi:hypothetical protein [uncultured Oscillibacter sp.]|uniref:hypothetical protein n=1 Tax=uncultured Oscillibacter sp. TaxID=876091 RepID=UPI0025D51658|nr:hypothetical protein [uncultured Oscillibacter sp.]
MSIHRQYSTIRANNKAGISRIPLEERAAKASLRQFLQNPVDAAATVCYDRLSRPEAVEGDMGKLSILSMSISLMIAAIVCALFSGKIDMAVNGDKAVKKVIVIFSAGVSSVCTIAIIASILS